MSKGRKDTYPEKSVFPSLFFFGSFPILKCCAEFRMYGGVTGNYELPIDSTSACVSPVACAIF